MAKIRLITSQLEKVLNQMPALQEDMNERAERVLRRAQELAPKDTGDLARSLHITKTIEGSRLVYRIVSDDPNIKEILEGTDGRYGNGVPPWNPGSPLGGWAGRHGFRTNVNKYKLALRIHLKGTAPAGTHSGQQNWVQEALREATR